MSFSSPVMTGEASGFHLPYTFIVLYGSFKWRLRSVSGLLSRVVFSRDQDSLDGYTDDAENDFCRGLTETDSRIHQASHFDIV